MEAPTRRNFEPQIVLNEYMTSGREEMLFEMAKHYCGYCGVGWIGFTPV